MFAKVYFADKVLIRKKEKFTKNFNCKQFVPIRYRTFSIKRRILVVMRFLIETILKHKYQSSKDQMPDQLLDSDEEREKNENVEMSILLHIIHLKPSVIV